MRVHRLTLRDYRGVTSCQLTFAERGITVVEGDNEAGKSSAAEALHLLLGYPDDSSNRRVVAVKPLHLDAGAEVEAELSVGPLRFTYAKRWHRDRFTRLRIASPRVEVVTGRDAHDRVLALLAGTVDLALWRALSAPQADGVDQLPLRDHPSLVAALDGAAGGALGTPEESDLLGRAAREAARWWTPLGKPKSALVDLRRQAEGAAAQTADLEGALAGLDTDVAWCADLERRLGDLTAKHGRAVADAAIAAERAAGLSAAHAEVAGLTVAAELAASRAELARRALATRATLAVAAATSADAADLAAAEQALADDAAEAAGAAHREAEAAASGATTTATAAGGAAERAAAHHAALHGAAALAEVAERLAEVEVVLADARRLQGEVDVAAGALAECRSTPSLLAAIQAAHDAAVRAEAALDAGRASVQVEALRHLVLHVDGQPQQLASGAVEVRGVSGELVVEVPGHLRITVAGGAAAGELEARQQEASALLARRCAEIGVRDLDGARVAEDERRALVADVQARQGDLAARLGGRTPSQLAEVATTARELLAASDVPTGPAPPPAALADARRLGDEAAADHRLAQRAADLAAGRAEATAAASAAASTHARRTALAAARAADEAARVHRLLVEARASATDDALGLDVTSAEEAALAARTIWQEAAEALDVEELDRATQVAQRTAAERDGMARASAQLREELAAVRSRLELQGESGLHDRHADAARASTALGAELASVEARAAAAQLLFATLLRHRDEAARTYGAPLRTQLERLGKLVFGPTFAVELDDELRIATRLLDGAPVPWSELSVGAREQLAVLSRLATAMLVSPSGGVPVVFDDVLGFTDPDRLTRMTEAFEAAGGLCQIIVLTCDPARYRHLARATTHCLTAPRAVDARRTG